MLLTIDHRTTYTYNEPISYGLQRLRLTPATGATQRVIEWETTVEGGTKQAKFQDQYGNHTELVRVDADAAALRIVGQGRVETLNHTGIVGAHVGHVPLWLYERSTELTTPGPGIEALVAELGDAHGHASGEEITRLHQLMALIGERVVYAGGFTKNGDPAEHALAVGHGVCQDHSHVFIAAARALGLPARYISGYLMMTDRVQQDASHAWAEAWIEGVGWVGFDPSNGISPDERYVRIACGLDYADAAPVSGVRFGPGDEALHVTVNVEQQ